MFQKAPAHGDNDGYLSEKHSFHPSLGAENGSLGALANRPTIVTDERADGFGGCGGNDGPAPGAGSPRLSPRELEAARNSALRKQRAEISPGAGAAAPFTGNAPGVARSGGRRRRGTRGGVSRNGGEHAGDERGVAVPEGYNLDYPPLGRK